MMTLAAENYITPVRPRLHEPAMADKVRSLLCPLELRTVVDATVGTGGHAEILLSATSARLLGLDRDAQALAVAAERLSRFGSRVVLRHADFADLAALVKAESFEPAGAILADLGMSSFALDDPARGFSFRLEGPLDMRMDVGQPLKASDIVNEESEAELARIIYEYGGERHSRRVAARIVAARQRSRIETTGQLRGLIERAVPGPGGRARIHPATRTFQALRIAVNHELSSLAALLRDGPHLLAPGGRMAIISYHSLEDRAVKERMRELVEGGGFSAVTRKVIKPSATEVGHNPRVRSARLRCIERDGEQSKKKSLHVDCSPLLGITKRQGQEP